MFKRVTWMGVGMVVGAAGAFRAKRKVTEAVERYLPEQVADRAAASARGLAGTVKAAATEGRTAMRETEAELRARVDARTFTGERPTTDRPATDRPATDRPATDRPGPAGEGRPNEAGAAPGPRRTGRVPRPGAASAGPRRRARR